jgi:hypothetical protein
MKHFFTVTNEKELSPILTRIYVLNKFHIGSDDATVSAYILYLVSECVTERLVDESHTRRQMSL